MNNKEIQQELETLRQQAAEIPERIKELEAKLNEQQEWRAPYGHFVAEAGMVTDDYASAYLDRCANYGVTFTTKEHAERAIELMRPHNKLIQYLMDKDPDYRPEWGDEKESKCSIDFDHFNNRFGKSYRYQSETMGCIYFSKETADELVEALNARLLPDFNHYFKD